MEGLASHWFHLSQRWMRSQKKRLQVAPARTDATDTTDWSFYRYEWAAVYLAHCRGCSRTGLNYVLWSKSNRQGWISRILAQDMKLSIGQRTDFNVKRELKTATCFKIRYNVCCGLQREETEKGTSKMWQPVKHHFSLRSSEWNSTSCLQNWQPGTILTQMPDLQWSWK